MSWEKLNPKNEPYLIQGGAGISVQRMHGWRYPLTAAQATATGAAVIHAAITMTTVAQTITTGITQPTCPRCLSVTGGHADCAGIVTITGTNINGDGITESITQNGVAKVLGAKAFKSVTSLAIPIRSSANVPTVTIGDSDILGLPLMLTAATDVLTCSVNGTLETVAGVSVSSTVICSNTVDPTSALAGTIVIFTGVVYS